MDIPNIYHPIDVGNEIRILTLHPAPAMKEHLVCDLSTVDFRTPPPYEALSYVWGRRTPPGSMLLCGQKIEVTPNLESALRHLRKPNSERYLWVDALCIDQDNLDERSKHVQCMAEVYKRCTADLLWFGPDDRTILDIFSRKKATGSASPDFTPLITAEVWDRVWIVQEVAFAPEVTLVAGQTTMAWIHLEQILDTVEIRDGADIPDMFPATRAQGNAMIGFVRKLMWRSLIFVHQQRAARRLLAEPDGKLEDSGNKCSCTIHQFEHVRLSGEGKRIDRIFRDSDDAQAQGLASKTVDVRNNASTALSDVMAKFRHQEATDPRDKIFALLTLCDNTLGIQPNYKMSTKELYIDTTRRILDHYRNLDLLTQGPWQLSNQSEVGKMLPSWVPDFSRPGMSRQIFAQKGLFCAGPPESPSPSTVLPSGSLVLDGWPIDTLAIVRPLPPRRPELKRINVALSYMPDPLLQEAVAQGADVSIEQYIKGVSDPPDYRDEPWELRFERYWRTVLMDCNRYPWARLTDGKDLEDKRSLFKQWIKQTRPGKAFTGLDSTVSDLLIDSLNFWHFAVTRDGLYCMVPPTAVSGMHIVAVAGGKAPLVLKPLDSEEHTFEMIGTCYVHDFMDGAAYQGERAGRRRQYEIE